MVFLYSVCVSPDDRLPLLHIQASPAPFQPAIIDTVRFHHRHMAISDLIRWAVDMAARASDSVFGMFHRHMCGGHWRHRLLNPRHVDHDPSHLRGGLGLRGRSGHCWGVEQKYLCLDLCDIGSDRFGKFENLVLSVGDLLLDLLHLLLDTCQAVIIQLDDPDVLVDAILLLCRWSFRQADCLAAVRALEVLTETCDPLDFAGIAPEADCMSAGDCDLPRFFTSLVADYTLPGFHLLGRHYLLVLDYRHDFVRHVHVILVRLTRGRGKKGSQFLVPASHDIKVAMMSPDINPFDVAKHQRAGGGL